MAELPPALVWVVVGVGAPLVAVTATAFAKAAVLLGILRGGLGVPGALPVAVTSGLAGVLALFVMLPVGREAAAAVQPDATPLQAAAQAWPTLERFLVSHTKPADAQTVAEVGRSLDPTPRDDPPARVLGFLLTELAAAFQLGVLLLLPFLVVDLLVANTLAVVGFHLLPPTLVALPFKLLLFVAADGWGLLVRGFVGSYG